MPKPPPTTPGTPRLSEIARHVVVPSGITSTGWPAVRDKCRDLGIGFDAWQDGTGRLILAKREDGLYATTVGGVVISIPRQVGKTFLLGAIVFALCLLFPNLTVIWTAHRLRTAGETFGSMQGMARKPKIRLHVAKVVLGSGDEEIQFHNGSRILFGARERGFGRGFSGVDVLVFDEAQILTEAAIDDMVPATNQSPNPLILFTGTPPKPTDPGEVFRMKRAEALSGESEDTVYVEFSADPDADPMDREQWRKANPSFPKRTPVGAMLRMHKNLTTESFIREALGVWDLSDKSYVIDPALWRAAADPTSKVTGRVVFAVDVPPDRSSACIAVASVREDGKQHLEVAKIVNRLSDVASELLAMQRKHNPRAVLLDPAGPAGSLIPDLERAGVRLTLVTSRMYGQACGALFDAVAADSVVHIDQPPLNEALMAAKRRKLGAAWAWDRKDGTDISPLVAVTLAKQGLDSTLTKDITANIW